MTDERDQALQRVALRSRIRTVSGGRLDLADHDLDPSMPAFVADGEAWYQTDDVRGLGPALRWAGAERAHALTLLAEADVAGHLARRAGHLDEPGGAVRRVEVWSARGPEVEPATPTPIEPAPELSPDHLRFASVIAEAGARPVDDHGLLVAEVAGLEVARVVDDPEVGGPRLAVGVGQADRELQGFVHGHLDDDTNLRRAIGAVARWRNPAAAGHPLSRLSRQRWLRSALLDDPALVGLDALEPVPPLRPRRTLLSQEPVAATGARRPSWSARSGSTSTSSPRPPTTATATTPGPGWSSWCPSGTAASWPGRWPSRSPTSRSSRSTAPGTCHPSPDRPSPAEIASSTHRNGG